MKWFQHDADAHADAKLEKVRIKYGMKGYGLYWYCLELIVRNIETDNITFELEHDSEVISVRTGIHFEQVQEMMKYMVELGLFENSHGKITCLKLAKRLNSSMTSNPMLREILKKSHDGVMMESDLVMQEENRIDKNIFRGKNFPQKKITKKNSTTKFTKPTLKQIQSYCNERSNNVDPQQFLDFYDMKNWYVGKNKMRDWKAAIRLWERNVSNQKQSEFINAI
jgi:hypothetical protein